MNDSQKKILDNELRIIFSEHNFKKGGMNKKKFNILLKSFDIPTPFKDIDIDYVFQAFDSDHNGLIDEDEFVNWISRGIRAGTSQRKFMKQRGALGKKLVQLLAVVTQRHKEYRRNLVVGTVKHLNESSEGLKSMIERVSKHLKLPPSSLVFSDVVWKDKVSKGMSQRLMVVTNDRLMTFVDAFKLSKSVPVLNISQVVHRSEKEEIDIMYVVDSDEVDETKKKKNKKNKKQNKRNEEKILTVIARDGLDLKLVDALAHVRTSHPAVVFATLSEKEIKEAIHTLFDEFDKDGNKHIDVDELEMLLTDICERGHATLTSPFSKEDVSNVLKTLDSDGNGTVEEEEFVQWVLAGMAITVEQRQKFANKAPLAKKCNQFLTAIANECCMTWENSMKR